jgi:uncharacterized protein YjiS (DUF1127 family)
MRTTISLSPSLATQAQRALQALAGRLGGAYHHWLRARQALVTARVLSQLDDRVLHDLGLSRSELLSTATELNGQATRERRRTLVDASRPR